MAINPFMVDDWVFKTRGYEWQEDIKIKCINNPDILAKLLWQIGAKQGGTIHQVIEYIQKHKEKWNLI